MYQYETHQLNLLLVLGCREKEDGAHRGAPWRMPYVYYIHDGSQQLNLLLVLGCREKIRCAPRAHIGFGQTPGQELRIQTEPPCEIIII